MAALAGLLMIYAKSAPAAGPSQNVLDTGSRLYGDSCGSCHGADGAGVPGDSPPMQNDPLVTGNPVTLIRVMTQGTAKITSQQEKSLYTNTMPADYHLSDDQIAALLTYMRHDFGGNASPITADQVTQVRKQYGGFDSNQP